MASSIRLADAGRPEAPPPGSARVFIEDHEGRLHLKMLRPDGTVEIFGAANLPISVESGGTGSTAIPLIGQILIGDGTKYKPGNIVAGRNISVVSTEDSVEISADIQDFFVTLEAPPEFSVSQSSMLGATTISLNKIVQEAHKIYAGPAEGANAEPTFRALVESDIPDLNSSKIIQLEDRIRESLPLSLEESTEISFNYDETTKKTAFSLKDSGVVAGVYGSQLDIPVITINSKGIVTSASTISIKESVEDYVGALIQSTDTINAEYDDLNAQILLNVNREELITTNISEIENFRAPTSQAIKQYVDDNVQAERNSRVSADVSLQNAITALQEQTGTNLQTQLSAFQTLIDQLTAQLAAETASRVAAEQELNNRINNGLLNAGSQVFTLSEQDVNSRFVTINSNKIVPHSANIVLERVSLLEDIDYTITPTDTGSTLSFLSELPIEAGEVVKISYLYTESLDTNVFAMYDNYVISAQDIERGYLVLSNRNALVESTTALVDRTPLLQGIDFVISKNLDNNVILTFIGDILPGRPFALEVGENIRVNYLYKN